MAVTLEDIIRLYRTHAAALAAVRDAERRLYAQWGSARLERFAPYRWLSAGLRGLGLPAYVRRRFRPKFDDVEAEITYLLLRHVAPASVVEIAPYYGWSTTWLLHGLRDNGGGRLHSYDLVDHSRRTVPAALAQGRWVLCRGDVRTTAANLPSGIGYLFIDAAHTADFAHWYVDTIFPRLQPGTLVGVHDIFRPAHLPQLSESPVVRDWLARRRVPYFTAAPSHAPEAFERIMMLKRELGLAEPIHHSLNNPMVFFQLP